MIKKILEKFIFFLDLNRKFNFSVGFNILDMRRFKELFFGTQNLLKHFQAPDIIKALQIKKHEGFRFWM